MAKNVSDNNAEELAKKKLQEEKEALLNEIKHTYSDEPIEEEISSDESAAEEINSDSDEPAETPDASDEIEDFTEPKVIARSPMPKYGKGFIMVPVSIGITIAAIVLGHIRPISNGIPSNPIFRYIYLGLGVLLLIAAILLIVNAVNEADILTNAQMGKLVTTGVYSKSRNPMYAGVLFGCTGALFVSGNAFMYVLPIIFYMIFSGVIANTEEKLLINRFGDEYKEYMENVYRLFPLPK